MIFKITSNTADFDISKSQIVGFLQFSSKKEVILRIQSDKLHKCNSIAAFILLQSVKIAYCLSWDDNIHLQSLTLDHHLLFVCQWEWTSSELFSCWYYYFEYVIQYWIYIYNHQSQWFSTEFIQNLTEYSLIRISAFITYKYFNSKC